MKATADVKISERHVTALDGVRAIAILAVMLFHLGAWIPEKVRVLHFVKECSWFGWAGVDLFFVLSGFLITGILLDTKTADNYFSAFYARRLLRIFPLYYVALALLSLSSRYWQSTSTPLPPHKIFYFFYLNNWSDLSVPFSHLQVTGHFWSLAVEEQFYLIWPVCVYVLPKRHVWRACLAGIVMALSVRCLLFGLYGHSDLIYKALFTRMDALLMGALCAIAVRHAHLLNKAKPYLGTAALLFIASAFGISAAIHELQFSLVSTYMQTFGYSFVALAFSLLVLWAYTNSSNRGVSHRILRSTPLTRIGRYSYGMYVYHIPLLAVAQDLAVRFHIDLARISRSFVFMASVYGATYLLAKTSYELYEKHFLRFKWRFQPRYAHPEELAEGVNITLATHCHGNAAILNSIVEKGVPATLQRSDSPAGPL